MLYSSIIFNLFDSTASGSVVNSQKLISSFIPLNKFSNPVLISLLLVKEKHSIKKLVLNKIFLRYPCFSSSVANLLKLSLTVLTNFFKDSESPLCAENCPGNINFVVSVVSKSL